MVVWMMVWQRGVTMSEVVCMRIWLRMMRALGRPAPLSVFRKVLFLRDQQKLSLSLSL